MADQGTEGLLSPFLRTQRIKAVMPFIKVSDEHKVLDYGCGSGELARYLTPSQYTGIDRDDESLTRAVKIFPDYTFLKPEKLKADMRFDIVVAMAIIEHMPSPVDFLKMLRNKLNYPTSKIVMTTPKPWGEILHGMGARIGLFSRHGHAEHQSMLNRKNIYEVAAKADLEVIVYKNFLYGINQLAVLMMAK